MANSPLLTMPILLDGKDFLPEIKSLFSEMESYKKKRGRNAFPENNTKAVETTINGHKISLINFDKTDSPQVIKIDNEKVASFTNRRIPDLNKLTQKLKIFL